MKRAEIKTGNRYIVRLGGNLTIVAIRTERPTRYIHSTKRVLQGGWDAINERTGRKIVIKSAAKLRQSAEGFEIKGCNVVRIDRRTPEQKITDALPTPGTDEDRASTDTERPAPYVDTNGTYHCPCSATHDRGPVNGVDVYRCLKCGQSNEVPPNHRIPVVTDTERPRATFREETPTERAEAIMRQKTQSKDAPLVHCDKCHFQTRSTSVGNIKLHEEAFPGHKVL